MQTNFTESQLKDPKIAEADAILRKCVHCGLCTATCPTYVLLGDERDSPRGRIYLIKEMFETGGDATPVVQHHVDRCLSCLSCMTTCPGGVDYMHLVDLARAHIDVTGKRTFKDRMIRGLLAAILPYPKRFRMALWLAVLGRPLRGVLKSVGMKELSAMLDLAPSRLPRRGKFRGPGVARPHQSRARRVALLAGCAQQVLRPEINDATVRLLARQGVEVVVSPKTGCCGALVHHMGREDEAIEAAMVNIDAWSDLMRDEPLDAIIMNASGCGTMVKDYGHLLKNEPGYSRRAEELSAITMDVTEFLSSFDHDAPQRWSSIKVAYHSACSMQHGQKILHEPRTLIQQAGFTLVEIPEGHLCCGSAGTYNILQSELATELRDRKIKNIERVKPDVIATGNIGCMTQLAKGTDIPVVHTVELLDWSLGGPCPRGLAFLSEKIRDLKSVYEPAAE